MLLTRPFGPNEEPVIRVADFGIAKQLGDDLSVTAADVITGTTAVIANATAILTKRIFIVLSSFFFAPS